MSWPSANQRNGIYDDKDGATATMAQAVRNGLVSSRIDLHTTSINQSNNPVDRSLANENEMMGYINALDNPNVAANSSNLVFLFQQHSHAPLDITADGLTSLLLKVDAFPSLATIFEAFVPRHTDYHLGQAACHFKSSKTSPAQPFAISELCALLKYVAQNERDSKGIKSNSWSIRNLGLYQRHDPVSKSETIFFVNISDALGLRIRQALQNQPGEFKPYEHWTLIPLLAISSLSANWRSFTTDLNEEVTQLTKDSGFTDPSRHQVGEANMKSLERCTVLVDKLQHAAHALQCNLTILKAIKEQGRKRRAAPAPVTPGKPSFDQEYDEFDNGIDDMTQELTFVRAHIALMQTRLDRTTTMIRDLISLRSTHTIEKLTVRSMIEARTVRLIAIVSLLFIPPTFTLVSLLRRVLVLAHGSGEQGLILGSQSFVQADMAHPFAPSASGQARVNSDLDLWFWFAVTGPLMLFTLGGWLYWDRMTTRKMNRDMEWKV